MADPVKTTRRYESPRRREQAAATRAEILEGAQRLFERDGYAATSMKAIAAEAGVALKTVYLAFETKSGVLRALWHLLLRGDEDEVPVGRRRWYRELLAVAEPRDLLGRYAEISRTVKTRAGAFMIVIRNAAAVDADGRDLWARIQSDFHENQRGIVEALDAKGALRPGLGVERATDLLWTLNHPDVWQLLVIERGWTPEEYAEWFRDATIAQLLR
jgi:AcrR family transcriptional regulator